MPTHSSAMSLTLSPPLCAVALSLSTVRRGARDVSRPVPRRSRTAAPDEWRRWECRHRRGNRVGPPLLFARHGRGGLAQRGPFAQQELLQLEGEALCRRCQRSATCVASGAPALIPSRQTLERSRLTTSTPGRWRSQWAISCVECPCSRSTILWRSQGPP